MAGVHGVRVGRGRAPAGAIRVPGDKSITHRALLLGAIAEGTTTIIGANPGEDCGRSVAAAAALGAEIGTGPEGWVLRGAGAARPVPAQPLDCGNSGTTLRLVAGLAAGRAGVTRLFGDASLSGRPMDRIATPLARMGARLEGTGPRCTPPLIVHGAPLRGIDYAAPQASAQVATALLLAGLAAEGTTRVTLPGAARDHSERMFPAFGVALEVIPGAAGGRQVAVTGGQVPRGLALRVPGDPSSAAFALAWAACLPGAAVTVCDMGLNPTRTALLEVMAEMGATVTVRATSTEAGEPVGEVTVSGPERLRAFDIPTPWLPRMIDEVPVWAVLAACAHGTSRLTGAAELRVKESDRLATVAAGLTACGIAVDAVPDGLMVHGGRVRGGAVATHHDHRIAMAFAILGAVSEQGVGLDDCRSIATSYPGFLASLAALGAVVEPLPA